MGDVDLTSASKLVGGAEVLLALLFSAGMDVERRFVDGRGTGVALGERLSEPEPGREVVEVEFERELGVGRTVGIDAIESARGFVLPEYAAELLLRVEDCARFVDRESEREWRVDDDDEIDSRGPGRGLVTVDISRTGYFEHTE